MAYFEQGSPAMQQLAAIVDRLEQMVDQAGLANLFYALEVVCSAMPQHACAGPPSDNVESKVSEPIAEPAHPYANATPLDRARILPSPWPTPRQSSAGAP